MKNDPIVEEARKAGQDYIDSFQGDLEAVFADLKRRTEKARQVGQHVASDVPCQVEPRSEPVKRV